MADRKISELTNITGANLADGDELVVVDASASETKAITFGEFKNALDTATGFVSITGDTMTGDLTVPNIIVSGNVDGRDLSVDGTKLDAIDQGVATTDSPTFAGLTTTADVSFGDNDKAIFGAGSDLQIYHDGNASYISDQGTGNLRLDGTDIQIRSAAGANMAAFVAGAEVQLYHNNQKKFDTTSTGVNITGTLTSDGLTVNAGASGNFGAVISSATQYSSDALRLQRNGVAAQGMNIAAGGETVVFDSQNTGSGGLHSIFEFKSTDETTTKNVAKFNGKTNDISFYEDTGTTPKFFWDASAESLGIGTSSPSQNLHIKGTTNVGIRIEANSNSASIVNFADPSDTNVGQILYDHTSNYMRFNTNDTEAMRIDSSGNLILKATSDTGNRLQINGADETSELLEIGITSGHAQFTATHASGGSNTAGFIFRTRNGTAGTNEKMRLDSSGNVGIGTSLTPIGSSASSRFITVAGSGDGVLQLTKTGSGGGAIASAAGTGMLFYTHTGTVGSESYTERMRIDSSGNLLVGTTNDQPHTGTSTGVAIRNDGGVFFTRANADVLNVNRTTSDGAIAQFRKDGSVVGSIGTQNSHLTIGKGDTGIKFQANEMIIPWNLEANTLRDDAIDFGNYNNRFKDLYLSGGVYLGGTGSANKLDDYEEGTFTPTIANLTNLTGTASITRAIYTKVGNLCTIQVRISGLTISSSATDTYFSATLPTAAAMDTASTPAITGVARATSFAATGVVVNYTNGNSTQVTVVFPAETVGSSGAFDITYSLTYRTA